MYCFLVAIAAEIDYSSVFPGSCFDMTCPSDADWLWVSDFVGAVVIDLLRVAVWFEIVGLLQVAAW